jgi:ABC-2 type transport system ATP-binding protein
MSRPATIEARNLSKSFMVPVRRRSHSPLSSLRHPRRDHGERRFKVLDDISFEVGQGEFFGIVGRNGSGKSTLLKLLASVYRADRGRIRIAGRLAPFLELGVGFHPQLPSYDNVVLNGVMMGLTPRQARARYEAIIDFAGLQDHTELRLKNYSSGMKLRLAFAMLTEVEADILLMDEVLAVGDSEFQQKCDATFQRMQAQGRTIVLVTHAMATITAHCERAMLIDEGRIDRIGDPTEVANRYMQVNMEAASARGELPADSFAAYWVETLADPPVRIVDVTLLGSDGLPTTGLDAREPIEVQAEIEFLREVDDPGFRFRVDDMQGRILLVGGPAELNLGPGPIRPGQRYRVGSRVDNHLAAGRYVLSSTVVRSADGGAPVPAAPISSVPFSIAEGPSPALLDIDSEDWTEPVEGSLSQ